jgi:DNA-binding transcriptional ArsR family regulator
MNTSIILSQLAAIGQDSRLAIVCLLAPVGPDGLTASRISEKLDIQPASLTFHLKKLTHAGLITSRNEGRQVIYSAEVAKVNSLICYLAEHCSDGILCGLVKAAEKLVKLG